MAESMWLKMRQAREALKQGRLEEAEERLREPLQRGYWRAFRIARELAQAYGVRVQRALASGQYASAWHDLLRAEELHPGNPRLAELRAELTERELRRFRAMLGRRDLEEATRVLDRLSQRRVSFDLLEPLYELVRDYSLVLQCAQRGQFEAAWQQYKRLAVPEWFAGEYQALGEELQQRRSQFESALPRLLQATRSGDHEAVILAAEQVLAAAPAYRHAQELHEQSWQALRQLPVTVASAPPAEGPSRTLTHVPSARTVSGGSLSRPTPIPERPRITQAATAGIPSRLLLWVHHVGSYLVCLNNGVSIGGHGYDHPPAIPICADLPRCQAEFCFDSEGFWLETSHNNVFLNGRRVQQTSDLLRDGDRITLGDACELHFLQPHPLFQTAVLRITSGHRLPLAIDAVILMGQQVVLGRHAHAHIPLPRPANGQSPPGDLCLCRSTEGLGVRVPDGEQFTIRWGQQSQTCSGWGLVHPGSIVEWTFCSLTLETDQLLRT